MELQYYAVKHITPILLLSLLFSCGTNETRDSLEKAESLIMENPDSAMIILAEINPTQLNGFNRALYAVTYSHGQYRTYQSEENDSLINIAVEYFERHTDKPRLMTSLYCQGRIHETACNYSEAIISAMQCDELARELANDYYIARANELIADIWSETHNYAKAIENRQLAVEHYRRSGHIPNSQYSTIDLAIDISNNGDHAKSIQILKSILSTPNSTDIHIEQYCQKSLIRPLWSLDSIETAYNAAVLSLNNCESFDSVYALCYMADIEANKGNMINANTLFDNASIILEHSNTRKNEVFLNLFKGRISERQNKYIEAIELYKRIYAYQDSVTQEILRQSVANNVTNLFKNRAEASNQKAHKFKNALTITLLLATIIVSLIVISYKIRERHRAIELKSKILELKNLNLQLIDYENKITNQSLSIAKSQLSQSFLESQIINLLKTQFSSINEICDELFAYQADEIPKRQKALAKKAEKLINSMKTKSFINELENILNDNVNDIIKKIRTQVPTLRPDEISFLCYCIAGFSMKSISIFTGLKYPSVYSKRKKIKQTIEHTNPKDLDLFISHIS